MPIKIGQGPYPKPEVNLGTGRGRHWAEPDAVNNLPVGVREKSNGVGLVGDHFALKVA